MCLFLPRLTASENRQLIAKATGMFAQRFTGAILDNAQALLVPGLVALLAHDDFAFNCFMLLCLEVRSRCA